MLQVLGGHENKENNSYRTTEGWEVKEEKQDLYHSTYPITKSNGIIDSQYKKR